MDCILDIQHPAYPETPGAIAQRRAVRGVVLRDTRILLLYTRRYDDYSLPGGGVDASESLEDALLREMMEETGARAIRLLAPLGRVDERRPHWGQFDAMHMQSFVFHCAVDGELGEPAMEHYESANGMRPLWVEVSEAIHHNQAVIQRAAASMGTNIIRETQLLQWVQENLLPQNQSSRSR